MAAAARNGTATFVGRSGNRYSIDIYISDVAAAAVTFNPSGAAGTGSLTFWKTPEQVTLVDVSLASGLTDTTNMTLTQDGGTVSGGVLRYANFLNTLAFRVPLAITFPAQVNVGAVQAA